MRKDRLIDVSHNWNIYPAFLDFRENSDFNDFPEKACLFKVLYELSILGICSYRLSDYESKDIQAKCRKDKETAKEIVSLFFNDDNNNVGPIPRQRTYKCRHYMPAVIFCKKKIYFYARVGYFLLGPLGLSIYRRGYHIQTGEFVENRAWKISGINFAGKMPTEIYQDTC